MKSRRSKSRKSKVGDESALNTGARASCLILHRSWDILSQSIAGRASRPRGADSSRKIYRHLLRRGYGRSRSRKGRKGTRRRWDRGLQIVDRESKGSWAARPLLHRSWDILSQSVLGASCSKSKAANEPASSSNPPHFDVQCWMFNVRCSLSSPPITSNEWTQK
jgi:hypothetical protein